jgi:serine/threonine protein kinase/DNA-binding NarL/FixJ family response regulator
LIADDHPIVRVGLLDVLSSQPDFEVVGEAVTGVEAVRLTDQLHPHVVLMDLRMPEMDGVTATAQIKAKHPNTYILIVTTQDGDAEILSAIKSGATGYLLKDAPREELFEAIRATAQGKSLLAPAIADRLMERIRSPAEEAPNSREAEEAPSSREAEGHMLEAEGAGKKDIASREQVSGPPAGTVTFLFTDIEGSTAMWERDPSRMQAALVRHDEILRSSIKASEGYVFKTVGDAFCAAFATARQALEATLAAQRALFAEEWDENTTVRVRMALHTGATEERDGDYFGPPVNRVARLLSAGHGGQVLLSAVTYGLVRDNLGFLEPGAELRDLGEHRLRDLRYSERIFQLAVPGLPSEFPSLETLDTRSNKRYSLAKLLGSGETAEVYLAHDRELDRDVAFKVLKSQYASAEQFVERFKRESQSAASLPHPNIVQVYDRGETEDGAYYMVMECVPGDTLKERITKEGPLPAPTAAALSLQIARALDVAHRHGVIHRDIKPQNILLTESGEAKVTDFGIARAASSSTITRSGLVMGAVHYISPEQALGQPASPQSDLYSLGVVLYEMLTGKVPHDAESPVRVAMGHIKGHLRPPKEVNRDVPEELNAVTVRLLARDPEERYQSAAELIRDLEQLQKGKKFPTFLPTQQPQRASPPSTTPASPFTGSSPRGQPRSQEWKPRAAPPGPPPVYPANARIYGARRRRVLPWVLVAAGVVTLLGIGIVVWLLVPYL